MFPNFPPWGSFPSNPPRRYQIVPQPLIFLSSASTNTDVILPGRAFLNKRTNPPTTTNRKKPCYLHKLSPEGNRPVLQFYPCMSSMHGIDFTSPPRIMTKPFCNGLIIYKSGWKETGKVAFSSTVLFLCSIAIVIFDFSWVSFWERQLLAAFTWGSFFLPSFVIGIFFFFCIFCIFSYFDDGI